MKTKPLKQFCLYSVPRIEIQIFELFIHNIEEIKVLTVVKYIFLNFYFNPLTKSIFSVMIYEIKSAGIAQ